MSAGRRLRGKNGGDAADRGNPPKGVQEAGHDDAMAADAHEQRHAQQVEQPRQHRHFGVEGRVEDIRHGQPAAAANQLAGQLNAGEYDENSQSQAGKPGVRRR